MSVITMGLLVALTAVLVAEFINGWTDAPNAIATVVSTGVMTPRNAVIMAVILNTVGAMAGTAVAATVGKGIVESQFLNLPAITAAMIAIIAWGTFAAKAGLPVSKSHALLAGLAGAGLAGGGFDALQISGWYKVFLGMFCAIPFGFVASILLGKLIIKLAGQTRPTRAKRWFDRAQIVSAGFMAFNHGLNDGQKFMGVFALTVYLGGASPKFEITWWMILICALTMGAGTASGGWRIVETIGSKMTRLVSWQGFAAEAAASSTIFVASMFGIPLSTTHTITSCIVGVGAARRVGDVRWGVLKKIVLAWVVTFPVCGAVAYVAALVANRMFAN
jgi:PiT family inorganic phosphate transporter